jgi:hypothetical protein
MCRIELGDRLKHPQRAAHRSLRVVLVGGGCAEHRHDSVSDELVDGAREALDLFPQSQMVGAQHRAHVFWIGLIGARRKADEIAEEHADLLAFLPPGGGGGGQRGRAGQAELGPLGVVFAAALADRHAPDRRRTPWACP